MLRIGLGLGLGSRLSGAPPMTPAELVAAVSAAATLYGVTIRGFWVADLGISQATTPGRVSAWAPQLGTMPSYLTASSGVEPIYSASDASYGGRASVASDGTMWMSNAFNPPIPTTTAEHRLGVMRLGRWVSGRSLCFAANGRFGARNNTRTGTSAMVGNTAVGPEVDNFEGRVAAYEVLCAGGAASLHRIGPPQNTATGVAIETQDPASTGLFADRVGTASTLWEGSLSCWLVASGTMSAPAVAAFEALFTTYCGGVSDTGVISALSARAHKIVRIVPFGASIMAGVGDTIDGNGYRKRIKDLAVAAGYTIDYFGTTTSGTGPDNQHSGLSGSGLNAGSVAITRWNANHGGANQFANWANWLWLSIGAADILVGTSGATTADLYQTFVQNALTTEPGIDTVIVMTEPPIDGSAPQNAEMLAYNNALRAPGGKWDLLAAANPGVTFLRVDLFAAMGEVYPPALMVPGQNHPNGAGYDVLAPVIWAAIQARLEARSKW